MSSAGGLTLALDTASPVVSVAVAADSCPLAERTVALRRSSERLVRLIDEALEEAEVSLRELRGVVALAGPGSFTGLRVGLATAYGLHQALALPAVALPTHDAIAWRARDLGLSGRLLAVVDALRDEWLVQAWRLESNGPEPLGAVRLTPASRLCTEPHPIVGFGLGPLAQKGRTGGLVELDRLAPAAARLAADRGYPWDAATLLHPLYYREPAITRPKPDDPA